MRYAIVIEKAEGNFSAYLPDVPGCVATGATVEEVETEIREAIAFHVEGLREDGLPVPPAASQVEYVEVGSRVSAFLFEEVRVFHRPHPSPNTDKGAVASIRKWLEQHGVEP